MGVCGSSLFGQYGMNWECAFVCQKTNSGLFFVLSGPIPEKKFVGKIGTGASRLGRVTGGRAVPPQLNRL